MSGLGSGITEATVLGAAGVVFLFALAVHAANRAGAHGAGVFAAWSAAAGTRLLSDVLVPWLPVPWATAAAVLGHVAAWIAPLLLLLFALRFTAAPGAGERWRARPFCVAGSVASLVVLSNPLHGAYLRSPWLDNDVVFGPLGWAMTAIGNGVVVVVVALLAVSLVRAAERRLPLALAIAGVFLNWAATVLPLFAWSPFGFGQVDVVMRAAAAGFFAVALFGFGLLRLAPLGREAVLQRMDDGWLVLDPAGRIADLNPAAARMFGVDARSAVGRDARDALRGVAGLDAVWRGDAATPFGIDARTSGDDAERDLDVHVGPLLGRRGRVLGRTLMVRDVTALRRAEARAVERERALAALEERERVARELHDGLAQVLGFVRLQAEAARGLVRRDAPTAEAYLSRLAATALEAHGEVRAFIAGSASGSREGFLAAIAAALRRLREDTGLDVDLSVDPVLGDDDLAPAVAAHVVRIVQEGLHNVRKHARARRVTVAVSADVACVQIVIADDGDGLAVPAGPLADPADPLATSGFGMRFMHERATAAGGSLTVASRPGEGTRVTVRVPRRAAAAEAPAVAAGSGRGG